MFRFLHLQLKKDYELQIAQILTKTIFFNLCKLV